MTAYARFFVFAISSVIFTLNCHAQSRELTPQERRGCEVPIRVTIWPASANPALRVSTESIKRLSYQHYQLCGNLLIAACNRDPKYEWVYGDRFGVLPYCARRPDVEEDLDSTVTPAPTPELIPQG